MPNLCNLTDVKSWLNIDVLNTAQDALFNRLIAAVSLEFLNAIGRFNLTPESTYTEVRLGNDKSEMAMQRWPINGITSVSVEGTAVAASPDGIANGYWIDPNLDPELRLKIQLIGSAFVAQAFPTIKIVYKAGYAGGTVTNEQVNIPGVTPFTNTVAQAATFGASTSVTYVIGGGALTKVTGTPAVGQYAVDDSGNYTFAAADAGKGVFITYSTSGVPADVRQAVLEWVAYRYKARAWTGESASDMLSTQGESIKFEGLLMPKSTEATIAFYAIKPHPEDDPVATVPAA